MTEIPKTYRVKSFGCQMNVYDGERMAELLGAEGLTGVSALFGTERSNWDAFVQVPGHAMRITRVNLTRLCDKSDTLFRRLLRFGFPSGLSSGDGGGMDDFTSREQPRPAPARTAAATNTRNQRMHVSPIKAAASGFSS